MGQAGMAQYFNKAHIIGRRRVIVVGGREDWSLCKN
jgi:hypothetical protein